MIDPYLVTTGLVSAAAVFFAVERHSWKKSCEMATEYWQEFNNVNLLLRSELNGIRLREGIRLEKLRLAGAKGKATQLANLAKKRTSDAAEAVVAREKTIDALSTTSLRSRAQVVAPVKAARTRKKNSQSGAGVAAKQG